MIGLGLAIPYVATRGGGTYVVTDANASTLIAAMNTAPSSSRKRTIDNTIISLKAAGLWTKLDALYVLAAHDSQAARLNWKAPASNTATEVSSPTFTADQGYTGNGTSSYLDSNFNPTTDPIATGTQDDNHIGVFVLNNVASNSAVGNPKQSVQPRAVSVDQFLGRAGNTSNTLIASSITDSRGHFVITRGDSANISGYINGALSATVAVVSAALDNSNFWICARNLNNFGTYQVSAAHWGKNLSGAEIASLYSILAGARG
jgi:hypothetical protein